MRQEHITKTELTGRNVEEIFIFNALAVTSTTSQFSNSIDLSKYSEIFVQAIDTHNQDIIIQLVINDMSYREWNGTSWVSRLATLTEDNKVYNLNSFFQNAFVLPFRNIKFQVTANTAPTSGSLTIKVWGVPN